MKGTSGDSNKYSHFSETVWDGLWIKEECKLLKWFPVNDKANQCGSSVVSKDLSVASIWITG